MSLPHLSVVVPAYNEEERLPRTLARLDEYYRSQPYPWDVTVISDGSSDATERIVEEFAQSHPGFRLIASRPNRGKGYVVRKGVLEAQGDLVLFCDADLATPQEETEKLLDHMRQGADVAIGSRPLRDSNLEVHQPFYREFLGRGFNKMVQLLAIRGIADTQCGFKMFTKKAAKDIFSRCKLDGFSFAERLKIKAKGYWWLLKPGGFIAPVVKHYFPYYKPGYHPWQEVEQPGYDEWLQGFNKARNPVEASEFMRAVMTR